MAEDVSVGRPSGALRKTLVPLALAQFICSFAGSNMNVMITDISEDLDTTVQGVQIAITLFLLVMAALMIPGGKLTDRWGRKRCFTIGLVIYGIGALMSAASPGLGVLILGNSIFEGVGTALLIPPVYILTTLLFSGHHVAGPGLWDHHRDGRHRRRRRTVDRRTHHHRHQLAGRIRLPSDRRRRDPVAEPRDIVDPVAPDPTRPFDTLGAVLSAVGLILVVMGVLAADNDLALMAVLLTVGAIVLAMFFLHIRARERRHEEPLLSTGLFRNRTSNLGLVTQNVQWLMLLGTAFVVSAYLQVVRGYNAIQTGVIFTAATGGILLSSLAAERLAKKYAQRTLIMAGFITTIAGVVVLLALVKGSPSAWAFAPGLLLIGLGVGVMLTPSVNVVQSAFPEEQQGEISGLSRCISNLGSSLGTAVAGTILVSGLTNRSYAASMIVLAIIGIVGLGAALFLPTQRAHHALDV